MWHIWPIRVNEKSIFLEPKLGKSLSWKNSQIWMRKKCGYIAPPSHSTCWNKHTSESWNETSPATTVRTISSSSVTIKVFPKMQFFFLGNSWMYFVIHRLSLRTNYPETLNQLDNILKILLFDLCTYIFK